MKTLKLYKTGCDLATTYNYDNDCQSSELSTDIYAIKGKDGNLYTISFSANSIDECYKYITRNSGKLYKQPADYMNDITLKATMTFTDGKYIYYEINRQSDVYRNHWKYDIAGILKAINYISADHYDAIEIA